MRYTSFVTALVVLSLPACSNSEADSRSPTVLLGSNESAVDTLSTVLVALQRDLLAGVAASDTAVLSRLIAGTFAAHDVRVAEAVPMAPGGGDRPLQLGYLEVMSGRLSDLVASDYGTYQAVPDGESALVFAFRADHAIQTAWRYRSARWQASRMIIMRPDDGRAMLEQTIGHE